MNTTLEVKPKPFYLATVDILQGICIFFFLIWHTMIWWNHEVDSIWPNLPIEASVFMTVALLIPPIFFFLYGFNTVNSLLRQKSDIQRQETRPRLIKKTIIFFVIAEFSEGMAGIVVSPAHLLNYLLTWELFHLFSLSTLILLLVFELAWYLERERQWDYLQGTKLLFAIILIFIIAVFLIFHDYSGEAGIQGLYTELNLESIIERIWLEDGQNPVIPWFSFPILGALVAAILDLPHEKQETLLPKIRGLSLLGASSLIIGFLLLTIEDFLAPPVLYPITSSFLFINLGCLILITLIMILYIDIHSNQIIIKATSPIILISNISLTTFIVHNVAYVIPPDLPLVKTLMPTLTSVMLLGVFYCVLFILVAIFWKKWNFKYSVEWMIWKFQRISWRRSR
jgi:hypothetical protein